MIHDKITFKFSIQPLMVDKFKQRKEKNQIDWFTTDSFTWINKNPNFLPKSTKPNKISQSSNQDWMQIGGNESKLRNLKHPHEWGIIQKNNFFQLHSFTPKEPKPIIPEYLITKNNKGRNKK